MSTPPLLSALPATGPPKLLKTPVISGFGFEPPPVAFLREQSSRHGFEEDVNWQSVGNIDVSEVTPPGYTRLKTFSGSDNELTLSRDHVRDLLREEISRQESRFVRAGVFLLVVGFVHQLLGYLIQL